VGDFNSPYLLIDRSSRPKQINKQASELKNTVDKMNLTAHGTFSKREHMLNHKMSLNKYKKIEMTSWALSDHNLIKLEINGKPQSNKNENTTYQNLWDTAKTVQKSKLYN
jgi:hypothetical protein